MYFNQYIVELKMIHFFYRFLCGKELSVRFKFFYCLITECDVFSVSSSLHSYSAYCLNDDLKLLNKK